MPVLLSSTPRSPPQLGFPPEFICPISLDPMVDPVVTIDGQTYERSAITKWFATSTKSPLTAQPLASKLLVPNVALRNAIQRAVDGLGIPGATQTKPKSDAESTPAANGTAVPAGAGQNQPAVP